VRADHVDDGQVNENQHQNGLHYDCQRNTRGLGRLLGLVGAVALGGLLVTSCGPDRNDALARIAPIGVAQAGGSTVNGVLDEWRVRADENSVPAGPVTFTFKNIGTTVHEMLVTRTDIPLGKISVDPASHIFNEDADSSKVIDEISELDVGKTGTVTIDLKPGTYQLVCNVPGHYKSGMYMAFTVTP